MRAPFVPGTREWLVHANRRVCDHFKREPVGRVEMCPCLYNVFTEALANPEQRSKYLHVLGRFDEVAAAFAEVQGTPEQEAWALFDRGKALRAGGHTGQVIPLLEEAGTRLPHTPWPPLVLALALAEQSEFAQARDCLEQAQGPIHVK